MKIAFIGQKGIPAKAGGVERHVEELATELVKNGHEVFVYARNNYTDKNLKEFQGIKLIHLPSISTKHLDAISHTFFASIHALFGNYDIIHYHAIGPSFLSFIPKIFGAKVKIISTYHCQDYFHQKWNWFARFCLKIGEVITVKAPHQTICVNKTIKNLAKEKYGKNLILIPNGMRVERTEEYNKLKKWGLEKNNYLVYIGRLIKHKGVHYLIKVFLELEKKNLTNGKKLAIIGDGFHTDNYVDELKKMAQESKSIIFTGSQSGQILQQLFSHAFLFVQPSDSEGLSIAILEAMGYGLNTLVSDIPENLEAINRNGFVFKKSNAIDLENQLRKILNLDQKKLQLISRKSKDYANKNYNWEKITKKIIKVYETKFD